MAEERLIDDDLNKDKKYRFRINENGEEELVIDDGEEEAEQDDVAEYNIYDLEEQEMDDEEAAVMTPEQLAIKRQREAEEAAKREADFLECVQNAKADLEEDKYATALEYLEKAKETSPEKAEIYYLNMYAYTKKFTDFTKIEEAAQSAEDFNRYSQGEFKKEAEPVLPVLKAQIYALNEEVAAKEEENAKAKAHRAERFNKDRASAITFITASAVALAAFLTLAIIFGNKIMSVKGGSQAYMILTIIFAALAFVAVILVIVAARSLNTALRRVRLNKKDSATAAGRELIQKRNRLNSFIAVYSALNGKNDLS